MNKIYRRIYVRIWADKKFRKLTPKAKFLWFYLLTGPHTTPLPGLFTAGMAGMAEALEWEPKAFTKAFKEVLTEGMIKADTDSRVIYVLNVIEYNPPQSPNVIKSWVPYYDCVPECELKTKYLHDLKDYMEGLTEGFSKAFTEAFSQDFPKQDRDRDKDKGQGHGRRRRKPKVNPPGNKLDDIFDRLKSIYPPTDPKPRTNTAKSKKALRARLEEGVSPNDLYKAIESYAISVKGKPSKTMGMQRFLGPDKEYEPYVNYKPPKRGIDEFKEGGEK